MLVKLRLNPKLVWELSDQADRAGLTLSELVALRLSPEPVEVPERGWSELTRERVAHFHGQGFTDEEIAARIGRVVGHVARVRRGLGLKINKRKAA